MATRYITRALACTTFAVFSSLASAADISVAMNEVRVISFGVPVKTVFVGNPQIADVTVIDPARVFLLGKNFGTTNLLALNQNGDPVANHRITVTGLTGSIVTLQRGTAQTTLVCAGERCQPSPVPGDDTGQFNAVSGQIGAREAAITAAAGGR